MNEWITALLYSPDKATYGQAALAIPHCSVNCELGTLPSGHIENGGDQSREDGTVGTSYSGGWALWSSFCSLAGLSRGLVRERAVSRRVLSAE
jgi:hypothetical protein